MWESPKSGLSPVDCEIARLYDIASICQAEFAQGAVLRFTNGRFRNRLHTGSYRIRFSGEVAFNRRWRLLAHVVRLT